jgi:c-di-GMP-binding flagellar brake protein YcgR
VAGEEKRRSMKTQEKRKHLRVNSLNLSYVCLDEDSKPVKQGMGRTLNLSESGILLETHFPIAAEHSVVLSIGLEDDLVELKGRPVHVHSKKQGVYEVGIEFVDTDENTRRTVRQFIRSLATP